MPAVVGLGCAQLTVCVGASGVRKLQDVVIYKDERFYCSFPSVVRRPDGELLVAFRRAPDRRRFGAASYTHTDPNSYLVLVRSRDEGKTWSETPELIYANPFGGSQDPCMVQLSDHSILCATYGWAMMNNVSRDRLPNVGWTGNFAFLGGSILRSQDGGRTWQRPIIPPHVPGDATLDIFGNPLPAANRGAMCEGKDRRLYWVVIGKMTSKPDHTATHLLISADKGNTWKYGCLVAGDNKIVFNETSLYETPKDELVAFMRTGNFDDHTAIARSKNHGLSFEKWVDAGFQGHPHHAVRLPDKRVLLVYGYRHPPFGVRARVLDAECTNAASAEETILRDDGGNGDLGYPWAAALPKNRAIVVYYFNSGDGTRYIGATVLEIERNRGLRGIRG